MLWVNLHSLRLLKNLMTALTNQLCEGSVMQSCCFADLNLEKMARKVKFNATNPIPYAFYTFV